MSRIATSFIKRLRSHAADCEAYVCRGALSELVCLVDKRAGNKELHLATCSWRIELGFVQFRFGEFSARRISSIHPASNSQAQEPARSPGESAEHLLGLRTERLWKEFFADPAQWLDKRLDKSHADDADFRHKDTFEGLWIQNRWTPSWVGAKLFPPPEYLEPEAEIASTSETPNFGPYGGSELRGGHTDVFSCAKNADGEFGKQAELPSLAFYTRLVQGCSQKGNLVEARQVLTQIIGAGHEANRDLGSAVVEMFVRCNSLADARKVFDKLPQRTEMCWTGMISAYVKCGQGRDALALYEQMQDARVSPSSYTFSAILKACGNLKDVDSGRNIHNEVIRRGLEADSFVGPAVLGMYAKNGSLLEARQVFDKCPQGNISLWNSMIAAYADNGYGKEALQLFGRLQQKGMQPSIHTYVHVLRACSSVGAMDEGNQIHADLRRSRLHLYPSVGSALVEMYAQWGQMDKAKKAFDDLPTQTVGAWNKLIRAYGNNDNPQMALQCFSGMQEQGVRPDGQTFSALLVTCSHQGLVHEGQHFFKVMKEDYGISPTLHHYTCMADVLGRSGLVHEAEQLLHSMPFEPTVVGWTSLLSACSRFGEVELGRRCFEHIVKIQPNNASGYLLMSRLYSSTGHKEEAANIERLRRYVGARNYPASVLIQVNSQIHEFLSGRGSRNHPMFRALQEKIKSVTENMKRQGFDVGDSPANWAPLGPPAEVTEVDKKAVVEFNKSMGPIVGRSRHSQNRLRMCASCHQWVKVLSLTEKRQVIMRDGYRTHHFKDGQCSCKDRDYSTVLVMSHRTCSMNSTTGYRYSYAAQ